jgi:hypothetical protein
MSPYLALGNNPFNGLDPNGQKWTWRRITLVAAAVVIAVVTDGLGDEFLAPAIAAEWGLTEAGAAVVSGVIAGTVSGAIGGGLLSENDFGSKAFWHDVGVGAFAGAVGGGIGGSLGEVEEGATLREAIIGGAERGAIEGAGGGFAYGVASGVNEGGHNFLEDLEMGISSSLTGAVIGGATGALEEGIGKAKEEYRESHPKPSRNGVDRRIAKGEKGLDILREAHRQGAKSVTFTDVFFKGLAHSNWMGSVLKEATEEGFDGKTETATEWLNKKLWGIQEEEEE